MQGEGGEGRIEKDMEERGEREGKHTKKKQTKAGLVVVSTQDIISA